MRSWASRRWVAGMGLREVIVEFDDGGTRSDGPAHAELGIKAASGCCLCEAWCGSAPCECCCSVCAAAQCAQLGSQAVSTAAQRGGQFELKLPLSSELRPAGLPRASGMWQLRHAFTAQIAHALTRLFSSTVIPRCCAHSRRS